MYECFCWFSHLKYDFGDQKLTSQKWCLEVHRTLSNDSRDKKRFSKGWMTQNSGFCGSIHKDIIPFQKKSF